MPPPLPYPNPSAIASALKELQFGVYILNVEPDDIPVLALEGGLYFGIRGEADERGKMYVIVPEKSVLRTALTIAVLKQGVDRGPTFDRLQERLMLTVGSSEAEAILQLAVQLVEEEREACAKLVLALPAGFGDLNRNDVAERIRNRK